MRKEMTNDIFWQRGGESLTLILPDQPVTVEGGSEDLVYRRTYHVQLPDGGEAIMLGTVWTFIGTDRGDVVEADIELSRNDGTRFYMRSFHKHDGLMGFESWDHYSPPPDGELAGGLALGGEVVVTFVARVVGFNQGSLKARVHFGVVLVEL